MDELLTQFIIEARELVQTAIDDLSALEATPADAATLDNVFRTVHTLKGSTSLFDLPVLHATLHSTEDLLGQVRSGEATLDGVDIDAIVAILEWLDACVDDLEAHGSVGAERLRQAGPLAAALGGDRAPLVPGASPATPASVEWAIDLLARVGKAAAVAFRYRPHPECFFSGDDPIALIARVPGLVHLSIEPAAPWAASNLFDPFRSNLVFEALSTAELCDVEAVFRLVPDQAEIVPLAASAVPPVAESAADETRPEAARGLRVDPARIDALLDLVGELMTAKNGMAGLASAANDLPGGADIARRIVATQRHLDSLTSALHGGVLQTRMVPVGHAFRRLPRLVRDLSRRLGKPVELVIQGETIEADKTIVDELFEPLLHLLRNAMDHGVESTPERHAAGKPTAARLDLQVETEGDRLTVSLSDDGRGIDPEAIRSSAVGKGIVTANHAAALDDRQALDLLFAAGFSTAKTVSDLSGRGVGLDAVRTSVARLGGSVGLNSRLGQGTTTVLQLPISFAMRQLLIVSVGSERYGVPLQSVTEIVRLRRDAVTPIRDNRAFVLRDRTVPLLSLSSLLGMPDTAQAEEMTVLVVAIAGQRVGIIVDSLAERIETITRPLGGLLTGMPGLDGTTVLGNGQVLLVLDMPRLIQ